jgi:hypothetical protein
MAFNDIESQLIKRDIDAFMTKRRPPPHIRHELDLGYRIDGQSIVIFEVRPVWQGRPDEKMEHAVAKITYVGTKKIWMVYWMRANLKWYQYEPAKTLEAALAVVAADDKCCFFG